MLQHERRGPLGRVFKRRRGGRRVEGSRVGRGLFSIQARLIRWYHIHAASLRMRRARRGGRSSASRTASRSLGRSSSLTTISGLAEGCSKVFFKALTHARKDGGDDEPSSTRRGESRKSPIRGTPICEYAMRRSERPHPALLVSPSTKEGSNCPAMLLSAGVFELATRSYPFEVPTWRNAQCDAVRRRMIFWLTSPRTKYPSP